MPGLLTIRRVRAEYRIDRETADPARIRDACDDAQRTRLAPALSGLLARWFDTAGDGVWLVRNLTLDVAANAAWTSDELAHVFAVHIARALARELSGDGDGVNAIRFPGPAAYLARFLADAATGDAWSRWYYARFDGLRSLPTSAALRTALVQDPQLGLAAMQRLTDPELARVAAALTAHDRGEVLDRFAAVTTADEVAPVLARTWSAWQQCAPTHADAGIGTLALFVRAAGAGCGGPALRAAIEALRAARELAAFLDAFEARTVVAWLCSGRSPETVFASLRPGVRSRFAHTAGVLPLLRAAPELLADIFAPRDGAVAAADEPAGAIASTPFGGAFFLLPRLDALPFEAWLASWPEPEDAAAASALRLLVLSKCMGGARAAAAFSDAVLRRLLHIGPEFTLAAARAWLRTAGVGRRSALQCVVENAADAESIALRMAADERTQLALPRDAGISRAWNDALGAIAQLLLRQFARRLPGFSGSRFAHLHRNFLDVAATLEEEPERLVVRVGRPPLHLVLNLTGMTRTSYAIRGEPRPIAVFAQD